MRRHCETNVGKHAQGGWHATTRTHRGEKPLARLRLRSCLRRRRRLRHQPQCQTVQWRVKSAAPTPLSPLHTTHTHANTTK